ncbi:MAG: hypothetical protein LBE31_06640 [Deltaproteobacteria bacterium]|jgi:hypothetical protein|nr:hypothetical protein [Deltaproteobacteria bacterium]
MLNLFIISKIPTLPKKKIKKINQPSTKARKESDRLTNQASKQEKKATDQQTD